VHSVGLFLLACLALGSTGCDKLRTVKQCRQLAASVNPKLEDIARVVSKAPNAAAYQQAAAGYLEAAKVLDTFDAGAPELDRAVDDYASTLRTSGMHAGELAAALDAGNQASAALTARQFAQLKQSQKSAVRRFEQECQGH
jgi:ABC-type transporter Mla subunit MlaD